MEILLLLGGAALLLLLGSRGASAETAPNSQAKADLERQRALERERTTLGARELERQRTFYIDSLRDRGWTGSTLLGDTAEAVYQNYLLEWNALTPTPEPTPDPTLRARELERQRTFYIDSLRDRGWTGSTLLGDTVEAVYQNYLLEWNALTPTPEPTPDPTPDPTLDPRLPKYRIGDRVMVSGSTQVRTISNWRWHETFQTWDYLMEDSPFTWWQESLLRAA